MLRRGVVLALIAQTSARVVQADGATVEEEWPGVLQGLTQPADAFSVPARGVSSWLARAQQLPRRAGQPVAAANVQELNSPEEFEKALKDAGDSLVIVDYATSWCGPCKIIAPKYEAMSEEYTGVNFFKVMGDSSKEADQLMRSQGIKALPSFHFWKKGELVEKVSGAKQEALRTAIEKYQ